MYCNYFVYVYLIFISFYLNIERCGKVYHTDVDIIENSYILVYDLFVGLTFERIGSHSDRGDGVECGIGASTLTIYHGHHDGQ